MKKLFTAVFALCLLLGSALPVQAEDQTAEDITAHTVFSGTGYRDLGFLSDGNTAMFRQAEANTAITLENPAGMAGLYLIFDLEYGPYSVTDNRTGISITAGQQGMLHEYVDLGVFGSLPTSVTLTFAASGAALSEITVYSPGALPERVQRWEAPLEGGADLVLFSTHGDDEHLYFAGLLPYYAGELGYRVQVVYLTDHRNDTNARTHEMLNGLWAVGVRAYPVFGGFADFRIDSLSGTYQRYAQRYGTSKEALLEFAVTQLRRFRPLVAVGHDLQGEYGHGMHQVYADLLTQAISLSAQESQFPESAQKYGLWQTPKLYLHLYEENTITLDYDKPLAAFDGMTAFAVSQKLGFPCHKSQQKWPMFVLWLYGTDGKRETAASITQYSPCRFGLYATQVGPDTAKNDFFENLKTYSQQEQEQLEQQRLEQERLEQQRLEQERLEQERLEQERLEQQRLEQQRLEQQRLEQQRLAQEAREALREKHIFWGTLTGVLTAVLLAWGLISKRKKKAPVSE